MSNPLPKAQNKKVIHLPSLVYEDGTPVDIYIRRMSIKHVGLDASMRIVQRNELARESAYRAEQGSVDAKAVADADPYPGTPPHHEYADAEDPQLKMDLLRQGEIRACEVACVTPTFAEICAAYDADPSAPWDGMGAEFETLVDAITEWSGYTDGGGKRMSAPEAERFPAGQRPAAGRDGRKVRGTSK